MSLKERERLKLFARVKLGELQQKQAAEICGLDYPQTQRIYLSLLAGAVSDAARACCASRDARTF